MGMNSELSTRKVAAVDMLKGRVRLFGKQRGYCSHTALTVVIVSLSAFILYNIYADIGSKKAVGTFMLQTLTKKSSDPKWQKEKALARRFVDRYCPGNSRLLRHLDHLDDIRDSNSAWRQTVLIVALNSAVKDTRSMREFMQFIDGMHALSFKKIVFCLPDISAKISQPFADRVVFHRVSFYKDIKETCECSFDECVAPVYAANKDADGFMLIADDTFVGLYKDSLIKNTDKILTRINNPVMRNMVTKCHSEWGLKKATNCNKSYFLAFYSEMPFTALKATYSKMRKHSDPFIRQCPEKLAKRSGSKDIFYHQPRMADFAYVPSSLMPKYLKLTGMFTSEYGASMASTLPNVLYCMDEDDYMLAEGINSWGKTRSDTLKYPWNDVERVISPNSLTHVHPIKLLKVAQANGNINTSKLSPQHRMLCDTIVPYYYGLPSNY